MPSLNLKDSLIDYLDKYHVKIKSEWLENQLNSSNSNNPDGNFEQIYRNWLEHDWNLSKQYCIPVLPSELNVNSINIEKRTVNGNYLLQVNNIIDISKPLPIGNEIDPDLVDEDGENENSDEDDNDDENFSKLFNKGNVPVGQKKPPKPNWLQNGPRMLEFLLTDGHSECIAIEYESLPYFNDKMIGIKILLSGPFDVYKGTIFLRKKNIKIISDKTFDIDYPECDQPSSESRQPQLQQENVDDEFFLDDENDIMELINNHHSQQVASLPSPPPPPSSNNNPNNNRQIMFADIDDDDDDIQIIE